VIDQIALMAMETTMLHLILGYCKADVEFEPGDCAKVVLVVAVQKLVALSDARGGEAKPI
jgi:hypothetical protein